MTEDTISLHELLEEASKQGKTLCLDPKCLVKPHWHPRHQNNWPDGVRVTVTQDGLSITAAR